ncbi:MAG: hypothetical protein PQJ60_14540 [Spirochaetales bacterium]|nr:hypothetical protein [Spirochaetales bacterium]
MSKKRKGRIILFLFIILILLIVMGIVKNNNAPSGEGNLPPILITPMKLQ